MRRTRLLTLLAILAVAGGCSNGGDLETVGGAQATTSSVVVETIPPPPAFPIPLPPVPPPPVPPGGGGGGGEILNVHSQVLAFTPGRTSWTSASSAVAITVRIDKAAPKAGDAVAFEAVVTSSAQACCGVVLRPGEDASFAAGGDLNCLPDAAAGTRTATFRWVHVYQSSGRFTFNVSARAGTCSEPPATGGLSGVIEVA
jgi:hypothetical protein